MLKPELRVHMKRTRAEVTTEQASFAEGAVWDAIRTLEGCVMVYVSIGSELPTRRLIPRMLDAGIRVAVPRLTGKTTMEAAELTSMEDLVPGGFRVPTSEGPVIVPDHVLVPGLAFDLRGGRLGYGAGYYDRWLSENPAHSIGLAFQCQIVDQVPLEAHDRPLERLLTEQGWLR